MRIHDIAQICKRIVNTWIEFAAIVIHVPGGCIEQQSEKRNEQNRKRRYVHSRLPAFTQQRFAARGGTDQRRRAWRRRRWALFVPIVTHFGGAGAGCAGAAAAACGSLVCRNCQSRSALRAPIFARSGPMRWIPSMTG